MSSCSGYRRQSAQHFQPPPPPGPPPQDERPAPLPPKGPLPPGPAFYDFSQLHDTKESMTKLRKAQTKVLEIEKEHRILENNICYECQDKIDKVSKADAMA